MPIHKCHIDDFIRLAQELPVFDARSEGEYGHAHIPGAFSLPIFSNEERRIIGTAYKQQSREEAIRLGLGYFGGQLLKHVDRAEAFLKAGDYKSRTVLLHCWRGGMRSSAMAWLLDLYGYKVYLLQGGYKAYRNWVLQQFDLPYRLHILSGQTGSNKTGTLKALQNLGEAVIDLEGLASHRGSAFGHLGLGAQPGQEQFENLLAAALYRCRTSHPGKAIWMEDESQRIGQVNIHPALFRQMREQDILLLQIPFEKRLDFLVSTYGIYDVAELVRSTERIQKKLGGPEYREALVCLEEKRIRDAFHILLQYYDRLYSKSRGKREVRLSKAIPIAVPDTEAGANAEILFNHVTSLH